MAVCAQCGSPVEGALCPKCGASADAPNAPEISPVVIPPLPAKTPKKGRFLFWALGGCILLLIVALIVGLFIAHRLGLNSGPPGAALAKLLLRNNPEIEIVSVDEDRGIIRVRDKKSGRVLTIDLENAQEGKIVLTDGTHQKLEIKTRGGDKDTAVEVQSADGSMSVGAGDEVRLPAWLPPYPNAESAGATGFNANQGKSGSFSFKSQDSVEAVAAFYEKALNRAGFRIDKSSSRIPGKGSIMVLSASDDKTGRTANMTAARIDDGTTVNLAFETR